MPISEFIDDWLEYRRELLSETRPDDIIGRTADSLTALGSQTD